jgi:hypothetical protein
MTKMSENLSPFLTLVEQGSDPTTPGAGNQLIYSKSGGVYVRNHAGTVTGPFGTGGGGGSDVVNVATGAGSVEIDGLKGSPDAKPGSPNAADDEFNALSGWTTLGSLDINNVTDFPSNLHLGNTSIGYAVNGIYKACPSIPFTVTAKLTDSYTASNYTQAALMLAESSPGKLYLLGPLFGGYTTLPSDLLNATWTNRTARSSVTDLNISVAMYGPFWLRMVVNSSSNIDLFYSWNGYVWYTKATATNPGFTVGAVGLAVAGNTSGGKVEAVFDWIRFS